MIDEQPLVFKKALVLKKNAKSPYVSYLQSKCFELRILFIIVTGMLIVDEIKFHWLLIIRGCVQMILLLLHTQMTGRILTYYIEDFMMMMMMMNSNNRSVTGQVAQSGACVADGVVFRGLRLVRASARRHASSLLRE